MLVIGSSNTDMVVKTSRFPMPGETIIGGDFFTFPGGKGANQAVAAARLGARTTFICRTGDDLFGRQALEGFRNEGIDTSFCSVDPEAASGVALITINAEGQNEIVVAPGANNRLMPEHLDAAKTAFINTEYVLFQLEIPMVTVSHGIKICWDLGIKAILNPAPAAPLDKNLYPKLYLITPNEKEAEMLTGITIDDLPSAEKAADRFLAWGTKQVIITLGAGGAYFKDGEQAFHIPAPVIKAVDTTAAGDIFNGALAVALSQGQSWKEAVGFAVKAASLSVSRLGAQASAPYLYEM